MLFCQSEFFLTFSLHYNQIRYANTQNIYDCLKMLLRVVSILTFYFFIPCLSNAASINFKNIPTITTKNIDFVSEKTEITQSLIVNDNQLSLSQELQTELASKITMTREYLLKLNDFLDKKVTPKIGLVYIHQGYDNWSLQFTYGGYLLNTETEIIVKTSEINDLRKIFANTESLQIISENYQTTQYMSQLGPILHESKD